MLWLLGLLMQSVFIVDVDAVAVLTNRDGAVEIRQPGLRFRDPLNAEVAIVSVHWRRRTVIDIDARLADGSICRVAAAAQFHIADAARAVVWRRENALPISDQRGDRVTHTEVGDAFEAALVEALATMAPEAAARGAARRWIADYERSAQGRVAPDGGRLVLVVVDAIDCERRTAQAGAGEGRGETVLGSGVRPSISLPERLGPPAEPQRFDASVRSAVVAPRFAGASIEVAVSVDAIMVDGARVRLEGVVARAVVSDPTRFAEALGTGEAAVVRARARIEPLVQTKLRAALSILAPDALPSFNLDTLVEEDDPLVARFRARAGVDIFDVDMSQSTFEFVSPLRR